MSSDCLKPKLSAIKNKFYTSKSIVKEWEDNFKQSHNGCKPSKEELSVAPENIKDAYKTYWSSYKYLKELKSQDGCTKLENACNNSLTEANPQKINDTLQCTNQTSKNDSQLPTEEHEVLQEPLMGSVSGVKEDNICLANITNSVDVVKNNVWGKHLNKSETFKGDSHESKTLSLYSKIAENMKNKPYGIVKTRTSLRRSQSVRKSIDHSEESVATLGDKTKINSVTTESDKECNNIDAYKPETVNNSSIFNHQESMTDICSTSTGISLQPLSSSDMNDTDDSSFQSNKVNLNNSAVVKSSSFKIKPLIKKKELNLNMHSISLLSGKSSTPSIVNRKFDRNWIRRCSSQNMIGSSNDDENLPEIRVTKPNIFPQQLDTDIDNSQVNAKAMELHPPVIGKRKCEDELESNWENKRTKVISSEDNDTKIEDDRMSDKELIYSSEEQSPVKKTRKKKIVIKRNTKIVSKKISTDIKESELTGTSSESRTNNKDNYDELLDMESKTVIRNGPFKRKFLTKEERLSNKVSSGKLNENFVKVNIKKKVFVRGKKRMTAEKYKRQEWKKNQVVKQAEAGNEGSIKKYTCFRCGEFGHWANKCPGKIGDKLMPVEDYDEMESTFLTLNEASDLAKGIKPNQSYSQSFNSDEMVKKTQEGDDDSDEDMFASVNIDRNFYDAKKVNAIEPPSVELKPTNEVVTDDKPSIPPLCQLKNGKVQPATSEVFETLKLFGYNNFRSGQEECIMRILSGMSTLLVRSTGSGKSLCYQLPAYLYAQHHNCITLCISPLVSLMEDQVTGLPSFLNAVCLHTQQTPAHKEKALNALRSGTAHILLVSPEAVVSSYGGGILGTLLKELPPIAFACLDEAHCLSEWSHNFRPSYLQLCKVLKDKLKVKTLLGLTATARKDTTLSIAKHLQISDFEDGIISGFMIPDNLFLSVSRDERREEALLSLLTGDRFGNCSSVIIYCTRRDECERVSTFIRTQLVSASKIDVSSNSKRQRGISLDAEAYHAGLSGYRRSQIQKRFMTGKLRIVVATVAFGMGIDKSDVRGIIHFNMPRNLESYVQEIGRAGRDGKDAHCHLFLDSSDGRDIQELKRHIFANSMDRFAVRKLLNKIFVPCICSKLNSFDLVDSVSDKLLNKQVCPGHEIALPIAPLVETLDLPEENIQTLLCYLEMNLEGRLKLSHHVYSSCTVSCYRGPKQLCYVSRSCPPLAAAIAFQRNSGVDFEKKNSITFPVVEISARMGWESRIVKQNLKRLEWDTSALGVGGSVRQSGVKVEMGELAFHVTCQGDISEEEQDQILEQLYRRAVTQEKDQLKQLNFTYEVLRKASHSTILLCCDSIDEERSRFMKTRICDYFNQSREEALDSIQVEEQLYIRPEVENRVRCDIRAMIGTYSDQNWTGRALARILHGISSPNYPAQVWGKVRRYWRLHLSIDFNLLTSIATKEILNLR